LITYKSSREIATMRRAGEVIVRVFEHLARQLSPGATTADVDREVEALIRGAGGIPSFKGYCGFPSSICASINEEVVHGIPGPRALRDGDLFTVDVGVIMDGYHADAARTFAVGSVDDSRASLADATARALDAGIEQCRPGLRLSDVAAAIEAVGRSSSYGIVEDYVGHGIGTQLHEAPQVPNFVSRRLRENDLVLKAGLVLALEPMFNLGTARTRTLADGWTVVTADGKCSAHFEDTVAITTDGPVVLTRAAGDRGSIWLGAPGLGRNRS
jgi:methionyl aminopeptidase